MRKVAAILVALTLIRAIPSRALDASLDAAITLYLSASYEEALVELARVAPGAVPSIRRTNIARCACSASIDPKRHKRRSNAWSCVGHCSRWTRRIRRSWC